MNHENNAKLTDTLLTLERAALVRWGAGDPSGYLEISAPDVVYFDPFLERRIDGRQALEQYYEGLRGKVHVESFEFLSPQVHATSEMALLTFNLICRVASGKELHWKASEVYRWSPEGWRIVHSHWSWAKAPTA